MTKIKNEEQENNAGADSNINNAPAKQTDDPKAKIDNPNQNTLRLKVKESIQNQLLDIDNMSDEEIREEAKEWGHIPKDEFRGDKTYYQNAEDFLRKSVRNVPAIKNRMKKKDKIIEMQKRTIENQQRDIEIQRLALAPKIKEAWENQDYDSFHNLQNREKKIEKMSEKLEEDKAFLNEDTSQESPQTPNEENEKVIQNNKDIQNWQLRNDRYGKDFEFTKKTDGLIIKYKRKYSNATAKQILDAVDIDLKQSSYKGNAYQSSNQGYSNMNKGRRTKAKTYDNLTSSAKRACNESMKYGVKKETYVRNSSNENFTWNGK